MIFGPKSGVYVDAVRAALQKDLFTITTKEQDEVVRKFLDWFSNDARLKPGTDLAKKILVIEPRLRQMARNLEVSVQAGRLVIRSDADSMALLSLLRRGSDWFDPHPSVETAVLLALAKR